MAIGDYDPLITGAASQWKIDPVLLKAVLMTENLQGDPNAVSSKGAIGVAQFLPSTAKDYGVDPRDPQSSIYGAAHYISDLLNQYGSPDVALDHYSGHSAGYGTTVLNNYRAVTFPQQGPGTQETKVTEPATSQAFTPGTTPPPGQRNASFTPPARASADLSISDQPGGRSEHLISAAEMSSAQSAPAPTTPPAAADKTTLTPDEHALLGGAPQKSAEAPQSAQAPEGATVLSPEEHALFGPASAPQKAAATASAPPPAAIPPASATPPIYQAADLNRPGGELSPDTRPDIAQMVAESRAAMPTGPGPAGIVTPENQAFAAGLWHGARQAVNPLLEFGSNLGNRIADATGLPIRTDRVANDAASETAFQQQYGADENAQAGARGARIGLPLALGGALGTATRLGLTAAGLPRVASYLSGGGIPQQTGPLGVLNRLLSGAVTGGYQGLAAGGPVGAMTGAGIGAALSPIAGLIGAGENRLMPETTAVRRIYEAMLRDGLTPEQALAELQRMGPLGTIADIPNARPAANLGTLSEGVANVAGPGQQIAAENLIPRAQGQAGRLIEQVRNATGNPQSAFQEAEDLRAAQQAAAGPAYRAAFDNTVVQPEEINRVAPWLVTPIGQRALRDGVANAQAEAVRLQQPVPSFADLGIEQGADGTLFLVPGQANLRALDAVKRGYDDLAETFRDPTTLVMNRTGSMPIAGMGPNGETANINARNITGLRDTYREQLRSMYPDYAAALDAYSGPAGALDALRLGRNVLSQDAERTAATVARFNPAEREMYQAGIAQTLIDRVLTKAAGTEAGAGMTPPNAVRAIFANGLMRQRIAAAFGGEASPEFQAFARDMENEATFAGASRYTAGSPTAHRAEAMAVAQGGQGLNLVSPLLHAFAGRPAAAFFDVAHQLGAPAVSRIVQPSERVNEALGNMLFNPRSQQETINLLMARPGPSARDVIMSPWGQAAAQAWANQRQRAAPP